MSDTALIKPVPITWSIVPNGSKFAAKIAPDNKPINKEEKTSLVISANEIAMIGGNNAHTEPTTSAEPPHVSHNGLPEQSGQATVFLIQPVATTTIRSAIITNDAVKSVIVFLLKNFFEFNIF